MKRVMCLFFLLFLIPIYRIEAKCMYSDLAEMKKIASNINYSYEYKIVGNDAFFDVTLVNLTKDIYFTDSVTNKTYKNKSGEYVLKNYQSGDTIIYNFYSNDADCLGTILYTIRIVLPKYNQYYNNPICTGVEEYSLCQRWSSHNLSYDKFLEKVNQYKSEKIEEMKKNKKEVDNDSLFHYIIIFLTDYYYVILIILGGTISVIAYIRNKRDSIYS